MVNILILYPDRSTLGGVVNFIETLRERIEPPVSTVQLVIGRRPGGRFISTSILTPLRDALCILRTVNRSPRPDVIHLNPSLNIKSVLRDGMFMLTLRLAGRSSVFVFWHGWRDDLARLICKNALTRWLFRLTFGYAAHTIVLTSKSYRTLREIGFSQSKLTMESTMFDGLQFRGVTRRPHQHLSILFLSRMITGKGGEQTIEAFGRLKRKYPRLQLIMAGDGPERAKLECKAEGLGVTDIYFPGFVRGGDKAQLLLDADIFVLPSYLDEGCPVSLIEAMAAGVACVASSAGGIPDIFRDQINGVLLENVSAESIENGIAKLIDNPSLRVRIGLHNYKEAWEKYEAGVVTRRISQHYSAIAELDALPTSN